MIFCCAPQKSEAHRLKPVLLSGLVAQVHLNWNRVVSSDRSRAAILTGPLPSWRIQSITLKTYSRKRLGCGPKCLPTRTVSAGHFPLRAGIFESMQLACYLMVWDTDQSKKQVGSDTGIRTRISALRGPRANPYTISPWCKSITTEILGGIRAAARKFSSLLLNLRKTQCASFPRHAACRRIPPSLGICAERDSSLRSE